MIFVERSTQTGREIEKFDMGIHIFMPMDIQVLIIIILLGNID
jgi:hypothetical protein